jgi:hypothetical protein
LIWFNNPPNWTLRNRTVWLEWGANPAILAPMKHRPRSPGHADPTRPRLLDMIDTRHELVRLAALLDWAWFEEHWAGFFPSPEGRPATHPRLVAGLMYLQHAYGLSDEAVLARWVENPYFQHFTGEAFFQHRLPIHPSSLSRWRRRIGEEGVEWLLTKTIAAGRAAGALTERSLSRVVVDTTVMEKAIAHPTDSRLYERARRSLVTLAAKAGIRLRQNYNRKAPRLAARAGRHAHARQPGQGPLGVCRQPCAPDAPFPDVWLRFADRRGRDSGNRRDRQRQHAFAHHRQGQQAAARAVTAASPGRSACAVADTPQSTLAVSQT